MSATASLQNAALLHPSFKWPSLHPSASHLKSQLLLRHPSSPNSAKGLFVFPAQSRVTGTKYSYQWISAAQEHHWHVLLDASALGPKDMDSLALSLFQPDFIITSFYKVFGSDPSGFGCLFIKNSAIPILQHQSNSPTSGVGIVRLVPLQNMSPTNSSSETLGDTEQKSLEIQEVDDGTVRGNSSGKRKAVGDVEIAFSAPIASFYRPRPSDTDCKEDNSWKIGLKSGDIGCDMESLQEEEAAYTNRQGLQHTTSRSTDAKLESCDSGIERILSCAISRDEDHVVAKTENDKGVLLGDNSEEELGRLAAGEGKRKGKMAVTPRSVLEESNDGESETTSELVERIDDDQAKLKHTLNCSEPGEASCVQRDWSDAEESTSSPRGPYLHSAKLENLSNIAPHKKSFLGYHSYEIGRNASRLASAAAFSQPLISLNTRRDYSIVHSDGSSYYAGSQEDLGFSSSLYDEDEESSMPDDDVSLARREPEIFCRGLNHADTLGLNKTNDRLRFLTNWLISSLLKLQHLNSNKFVPLVHIYGPKAKDDRGASLAFNLFDRDGILIRPTLVQQFADRNSISLGTALLYHIQFPENCSNLQGLLEPMQDHTPPHTLSPQGFLEQGGKAPRFAVVTAALGFVTNFEDVYRLWAFVAKFLDTECVLNELCAYNSQVLGL